MKCPACGKDTVSEFSHFNHAWTYKLIDPAELLDLIEKVRGKTDAWDHVISYLSGDPEPLKKLAGE